jgi:hypothetical protein
MKTFNEIAAEYAPYHQMKEFQVGAQDYMDGNHRNGDNYNGVAGQAWDRGANAAMRFTQQHGGKVNQRRSLARGSAHPPVHNSPGMSDKIATTTIFLPPAVISPIVLWTERR